MTASPAPLAPWLPGLAEAAAGLPVTDGARRPGRHVAVRRATASRALHEPDRLDLAVAPGDEAFALALVGAFAAPAGRPVAADPASLTLHSLAARVARRDTTVLIEGASGTGKEGLARLLHTLSPRRDAPFVAVNCAALPESMAESLLFGHERGAFTGAHAFAAGLIRAADGGTLFLDEIGELSLALQAKLLRALQEREVLSVGATRPVPVDVRIVAAGNRDLAADAAAGRFRADLYWRLAVFPLKTLPLAERPADIPIITARRLLGACPDGLVPWPTPAALARLVAHRWPGNVRELGNVLDRALVLADGPALTPAQLLIAPAPDDPAALAPLPQFLKARAGEAIARALAETGSQARAAARLGISERTLRYRLAALRGQDVIVQDRAVQ